MFIDNKSRILFEVEYIDFATKNGKIVMPIPCLVKGMLFGIDS